MWEKKLTISERQTLYNHLSEKLLRHCSHLENSCKFSLSQIPKVERGTGRAMVSADGGLVFSTKAGRKQRFNTWVQTHSGTNMSYRKRRTRFKNPGLQAIFHRTVVFHLGQFFTSSVTKLTEKTVHSTLY